MRHKQILNTFYGTPEQRIAWEKRIEEERKKNREKMEEYKKREALRLQLVLPMDVPPIVLCERCRGIGCKDCNGKGVIQGKIPENQPIIEIECRRCWGVGRVATTTLVVKNCPNCNGTGKIEAPIE